MIVEGIVALLKANSAVMALCHGQIYPQVPPENTKGAYVLYQVISWPSWRTLQGRMDTGVMRVQMSAWASRYGDASALGMAIRAAIEDFGGPLAGATDVALVQDVACDSYHDAFDDQVGGGLHGTQADYLWTFTRSNPS